MSKSYTEENMLSLEEVESLNLTNVETAIERSLPLLKITSVPEVQISEFIAHTAPGAMLDVGCGIARYADHFGVFERYCGIDLSKRAILAAHNLNPSLEFRVMSYRALQSPVNSFPDCTFDGVWQCCSFSYEPKANLPKVLKGIHRVLKPGGTFTIIEGCVGEAEDALNDEAEHGPCWLALWLLEELQAVVEEAGFKMRESYELPQDGAIVLHANRI